MNVTPECAALLYLNWWREHDRDTLENLKDEISAENRLRALDCVLRTYRIARKIPGKDVATRMNRLSKVLITLSRFSRPPDEKTAIHTVETFAGTLGRMIAEWGGKLENCHSLASKLLWQRFPAEIVIVDSRARRALGFGTSAKYSYSKFVTTWQKRYSKERQAVNQACASLPGVMVFSKCAKGVSEIELDAAAIIRKRWFKKRVLDQILWNEGGVP